MLPEGHQHVPLFLSFLPDRGAARRRSGRGRRSLFFCPSPSLGSYILFRHPLPRPLTRGPRVRAMGADRVIRGGDLSHSFSFSALPFSVLALTGDARRRSGLGRLSPSAPCCGRRRVGRRSATCLPAWGPRSSAPCWRGAGSRCISPTGAPPPLSYFFGDIYHLKTFNASLSF